MIHVHTSKHCVTKKKGERWKLLRKKPAVTLWMYEICDDQHGFWKEASFKGRDTNFQTHRTLAFFRRSNNTTKELWKQLRKLGERGGREILSKGSKIA